MKIKTEKQELEEKEFWELEKLLKWTSYDETDLILMYSNALMGTFSNNIEQKISEIFEKGISTTRVQNFIDNYFRKKEVLKKIRKIALFEKEEDETILNNFLEWKYEKIYVNDIFGRMYSIDFTNIWLLLNIIETYEKNKLNRKMKISLKYNNSILTTLGLVIH